MALQWTNEEGTSTHFEQAYIVRFFVSGTKLPDKQEITRLGDWEEQEKNVFKLVSKESQKEIEKTLEKNLKQQCGTDFRVDIDENTVFFTL